MVGREISPTDVGKHAKIIKAAQDEMAAMDVLVCGRCLTVFHFIEDFKQHKQKPCQKESNNVRECNDTKPKIWAFLLWKATQLHNNKDSNTASPNSWALYQTWVKMDEGLRETWIVAGKTIQSFAKVGQGGLQEMPVKITKTVVNNNNDNISPGRKPLNQTKPQVANLKPPLKMPAVSKSHDSESDTSPVKAAVAGPTALQKIIKKPVVASATTQNQGKINLTSAVGAKATSRRAKRTVPNSDEIVEENVEKIVAKRFNPRRKMHEYLVKWESRTHEQNTWEPVPHLENVPHLLETFEKQLARQKESRAAMQAKQLAAVKAADVSKVGEVAKKDSNTAITPRQIKLPTLNSSADANSSTDSKLASPGETSSGRPSRTSKTKAMDQVKQWVTGSSSAAASPNSVHSEAATSHAAGGNDRERDWSMNTSNTTLAAKRKLTETDFDDSNASDLPSTTATMEDLEEDLIPSHTVKRMKNGNAVSVEVKTKNDKSVESKLIKVNGTTSRTSSVSGESLAVGPNSAEVIITQDSNASGVVKKPGFNGNSASNNSQKTEAQIRVLSKGESAVSSTGIVRLLGGDSPLPTVTRTQQIRVGGGRQTPTGSTTISTVARQQQIQRTTPGGTTIQRKTIGGATISQRTATMQTRTGQQASPSSGRMIIPRQGNTVARTSTMAKHVTPEQKILQLSKSGDLKVTKKVMTREDLIARQRQQNQHQSQVQIQKVQQITPPVGSSSSGRVSSVSVRKHSESSYAPEEHQAQLCPITGKLIGQDDSPTQQSSSLQTQISDGDQQVSAQQQDQQQLQDIDPTLLLTNDQQMLTNEDGSPLLVTGEDGTVYQVAGKNAEGQTILVTQGPDGEQQFAYVAAAEGDENQVLTLDTAVAEAVSQLPAEQQAEALAAAAGEGQYIVKTTQEDGTTQMVTMSETELAQHQALAQQQQQQQQAASGGTASGGTTAATGQLCIQTGDGSDGQEANIPAEVVQADMPSPGGTRRVVLLLQDGTFMMTEMHDDEFKALNIAA